MKKNKKKNIDKENFLVGSVNNLQSKLNKGFQENALKEYDQNECGPWFDTLTQKTLCFLNRLPFEWKRLNLLIFDLFNGYINCIFI